MIAEQSGENMTPEISEFSYGFALTNEVVAWAPLSAAPVFPSLIEEGKAGGGYDVKLDMPGVPLYLQFKRADSMRRRSAKELQFYNLPLRCPFYRFRITEAGKSNQHEMLLELDDGSCQVYYAAPKFHEIAEINEAWAQNAVASRSIFVAPGMIGPLDTASHHVAFDERNAWLCSEPKLIEHLGSRQLLEKLQSRLKHDDRPLRQKIPEMVTSIRSAEVRARARTTERRRTEREIEIGFDRREAHDELFERPPFEEDAEIPTAPEPPIPKKSGRDLSESEMQLRDIADTAARSFHAQLVVVQPSG